MGCPPVPDLGEAVKVRELDPDPAPVVPAVAPLPTLFPPAVTDEPEAEAAAPQYEESRGDPVVVAAPTPEAKPNPAIASTAIARIDPLSPEEKIALFS